MDARIQRAPPDGLERIRTARRKRRHCQQTASARVDAAQYRGHEEDAPALRLQLRLGPRSDDLRTSVLSLESVVLPQNAGARPLLSQARAAELVSQVPNRAG